MHPTATPPFLLNSPSTNTNPQLAPAVQFQLALAGALSGWKYGLVAAVTPLTEGEDAKDRLFDEEIEGIRASATAKANAADATGVGEKAKEPALTA